jgi:hypothetical protein
LFCKIFFKKNRVKSLPVPLGDRKPDNSTGCVVVCGVTCRSLPVSGRVGGCHAVGRRCNLFHKTRAGKKKSAPEKRMLGPNEARNIAMLTILPTKSCIHR